MARWTGTNGDDNYNGTDGDDEIHGLGGDDDLNGKDGDDHIEGGDGDDKLDGGDGDDEIHGGAGDDDIKGKDGDDVLDGGAGNDEVRGYDDDDRLIYDRAENVGSTDLYDGNGDTDTLVLRLDAPAEPALQAEIAAFEALSSSQRQDPFTFETLGLTVVNVERIEVESGYVPPFAARDDAFDVSEDGTRNFDLLANDVGAGLTLVSVDAGGTRGRIGREADGTVTYETRGRFEELGEGETATDTFAYAVRHGDGRVEWARATVTIEGANDAPVVPSEPVVLDASQAGAPRGVFYADLLRGVGDVDGDHLSVVGVAGVTNGIEARFGPSGIVFRPDLHPTDPDYAGPVEFTVEITDGNGATVTRTAAFELTAPDIPNRAPTGPARLALAAGEEDVNRTITTDELMAGVVDPDGDALSLIDLSVSSGRILDLEDGTYAYDPAADVNGPVTFSYTVTDGEQMLAREATMVLAPRNDAPTLSASYASVEFTSGGVDHTRTTVTFTASDPDGDAVTLALAPGGVAYNAVAVEAAHLEPVFDAGTGTLTVTHSNDMRADLVFAVTASDGTAVARHDGWLVRADWIDLAAGEARVDAARPEVLLGRDTGERIFGGGGRDRIEGRGGDDVLVGDAVADVLDGGAGADRVHGRGGDDIMFGRAGGDVLYGGTGADWMEGGDGRDELRGGTGADTIQGGAGNDIVVGEAGDDALYGGTGGDRMVGGAGDDRLYGHEDGDRLFGGAGDDHLNGGDGRDLLIGGAGADTFRIAGDQGHGGRDVIMDYARGLDTVQLDIGRPDGEVVPLTRGDVLATQTLADGLYTYEFGDTSFSTRVELLASDIEIV